MSEAATRRYSHDPPRAPSPRVAGDLDADRGRGRGAAGHMKFAYADPPYLGMARFYAALHPEAMIWDDPETHRRLILRLSDDYPDGWALSLTSTTLRQILPMCPEDVRIASWVKPFASFKPGVPVAYAWEPVIFRGGRRRGKDELTTRDWIACNITLQRGLVGAKPRKVCRWIFDLLGARRGDTLDDLFPGSGAVSSAWNEWTGEPMQLVMEAVA